MLDRGYSKTPEYEAWRKMLQRCLNPSHRAYPRYGGRGITVALEWQRSFEAFLSAVGRRPSADHSIDRIDNDGNYKPGNVRWATKVEQTRNRRSTRYVPTPAGDATIPAAEASATFSIKPRTLRDRADRGLTGRALYAEADALYPRGETHPSAKITADNVQEIRRLLKAGELQRVIGARFGITQVMVSRIKRGTSWTSLPSSQPEQSQ